jgi:hypothetical protein
MLTSLLSLALATAHAADPVPVPTAATTVEAPVATTAIQRRSDRNLDVELSFRSRWMIAPRGLVTAFGFEDDRSGYDWALRKDSAYCREHPGDASNPDKACGKGRPGVSGQAYGFEALLKWPKRRDTMIVYVDWVDSNMTHGYWDDREDGEDPDDPEDGDYLVPGKSFGLLVVGVDYQADIPIVKLAKTKNVFGLDFTAGAGLGAIVMLGRLDRYTGDAKDPSYAKYDAGERPDPDDRVGRLWPAIDVNIGFKLNFGDRVVMRLEGGLHTLLYAGGTVGFKF